MNCKYWNRKKAECENSIIYLNLPEKVSNNTLTKEELLYFNLEKEVYYDINDLRTGPNFFCKYFKASDE